MTIKVDETTLLTFLLDWQAWAGSKDRKSPCGAVYRKTGGLCNMVELFIVAVYDKHSVADQLNAEQALLGMMKKRWEDEYLPDTYPFGRARYREDSVYKTMHLCPHRLQWVADTIAELTVPAPEPAQDVWRKEYNITWLLRLLVIVLAALAVYCLSATFAKADEFSGGHPVLEVYGCPVMTQDKLECRRELYDIDGTYDDCEQLAQSLRTNPGIIKSVCHFQH